MISGLIIGMKEIRKVFLTLELLPNTTLSVLFPLQYKSCCIRRHAGLFSKTCLDYKTCHTIYSKTRLKYRTQQPSVDVTMTSSLLSSKKKRFKTRVQQQTQQTFTQRPGWNKRIWGEIPFLSNKDPVTCIEEERVPFLKNECAP